MSLLVNPPSSNNFIHAQNIAQSLLGMPAARFAELSYFQKNSIDILWNNWQATPAEILSALDTNAGALFDFHAALTLFIAQLAATNGVDYTPALPPLAYTRHEDGRVTLVE